MAFDLLAGARSAASRLWGWIVLRGVLAILFGILALLWPAITVLVLVLSLGIYAILDGVLALTPGGRLRVPGVTPLRVALAVLSILFGLVLLVWPAKTAAALVVVVGVWAVVSGVFGVAQAFAARSIPRSHWGWGVVAGLLSVAFGVLVLSNIGAGLLSIVWVIGIWAIALGVTLVGLGLDARRFAAAR